MVCGSKIDLRTEGTIFETLTWNNKTRQRKESMHWGKNWSTENSKGNKTVPGKVATTRTEDGYKWNIKTSTTISTKRTKEHRTTEEEMEGTNFILRIKEQETHLTLHERDDDDDERRALTCECQWRFGWSTDRPA